MASAYDKASLVMLPNAYKDGKVYSVKPEDRSGDFTFTRPTAATRVDVNGLIEKGRENLLLRSNSFNSAPWSTSSSDATIGQSGYDGTNDAWLLSKTAINGRAQQNISTSGVQTFSVYAKAGTKNWTNLLINGGPSVFFDLQNGVLGSASNYIDANIESVGNGFYRCSVTFNATISRVRIYVSDDNNNNTGTSGNIIIQDAQLEVGLAATEYIESGATRGTAGILEDTPRFNYSFGASCPSLLLEPSRTNVVTNSEYINGVEWNGKINVSFGTNQTISPEGLLNSASIIENTTNGSHFAYEDFTLTSGASYAISIYAKKNGVNRNLRFNDGGLGWSSGFNGVFDLTAGTATGGVMEDVGNGWYRCSVTGTTNATASRLIIYPTLGAATSYPGDGTSGVFLYGFQIEAGSYVSSYIPNHSGGGSVTRAADVCGGAGDASTFNDSEGVLYVEIAALADLTSQRWISIGSGSNANRVSILFNATSKISCSVRGSSAAIYDASANIGGQTNNTKAAIKYKNSDFSFFVNGLKVDSQQSGSISFNAPLSELAFDSADGASDFYGNVKQVLTFNTALSDADLAALTTI
jgi:hypothetical protein